MQKNCGLVPVLSNDAQFIYDEIDASTSLVLLNTRHRKIAGSDDAAKLLRGVAREPR
jgi:hypothetical protein